MQSVFRHWWIAALLVVWWIAAFLVGWCLPEQPVSVSRPTFYSRPTLAPVPELARRWLKDNPYPECEMLRNLYGNLQAFPEFKITSWEGRFEAPLDPQNPEGGEFYRCWSQPVFSGEVLIRFYYESVDKSGTAYKGLAYVHLDRDRCVKSEQMKGNEHRTPEKTGPAPGASSEGPARGIKNLPKSPCPRWTRLTPVRGS
jgi:hypothetical protein